MVAQIYGWQDPQKKKHFALALQKNPLKWLQTQNLGAATTWDALKAYFLKTFEKTRFELDLEGESGKMLTSENRLRYVSHVLSYVAITNPTGTELEKTNRLLDGHPRALKADLVRGTPQSGHDFSERLKSGAVEHSYKQSALIGALSPAALSALANAESAAASAFALRKIYPAQEIALNKSNVLVPTYANAVGLPAAITEHVSELVKAAKKDAKIEALEKQIKELMFQRQGSTQYHTRGQNVNSVTSNGKYRGSSGRRRKNYRQPTPDTTIAPDGRQLRIFRAYPSFLSSLVWPDRRDFSNGGSTVPVQSTN